jgi:hypothetical protein
LVSKTTDEKDDSIAQKRIVNTAIFCSGAGTE